MKPLFLHWLLRAFNRTALAAGVALLLIGLAGSTAQRVWIVLAVLAALGIAGSLWTRWLIARERAGTA